MKMERLGLGLSGESTRVLSISDMIDYIKLAEARGVESVWVAEDYYFKNAISLLGIFASVTKKVKLATGIINPYSRTPALIAMSSAFIDEISQGRFILGLGASLRLLLYEPAILGWKKPNHLVAIREAVELIRLILTGRKITYGGEAFQALNVQLGSKPLRTKIPIYLGAMGPKMLQLAGEIADGVLLTAGSTPEYIKYAIKNIEVGAMNIDNKKNVDVAAYITVSVSDDVETAREAVREQVAFLVTLSRFDPILAMSGLNMKNVRRIREEGQKGNILKASKFVTQDLIEHLTICGTPKDCKQKLSKYKLAGLDLPIILPVGNTESIRKAIKELIN